MRTDLWSGMFWTGATGWVSQVSKHWSFSNVASSRSRCSCKNLTGYLYHVLVKASRLGVEGSLRSCSASTGMDSSRAFQGIPTSMLSRHAKLTRFLRHNTHHTTCVEGRFVRRCCTKPVSNIPTITIPRYTVSVYTRPHNTNRRVTTYAPSTSGDTVGLSSPTL